MNAHAGFHTADRAAAAPPPAGFDDPAAAWTGPRQRVVLEAFAEGCTVPDACRRVGLSPASLYAFANSAEGGRFAVGWDTAVLRSRRAIQDLALSRVIDGFEERTLRPDGSVVVRHRYDNRLMLRMLERLDRHAESYGPKSLAGARHIDEDFGEFLDSISDDPAANHAAIVESARPGALPGWAGRHAPTVFDTPPVDPAAAADRAAPEPFVSAPEPRPAAPSPAPLLDRHAPPHQEPGRQDTAGGDFAQLEPASIAVYTVHDSNRTLVDMIVTTHSESLTREQAEERAYAILRARSDGALPATLATLRALHGSTGQVPAEWRKLWHRGDEAFTEIGILGLGDAPAGQGSV